MTNPESLSHEQLSTSCLKTDGFIVNRTRFGLPMWFMDEWRGQLFPNDMPRADALCHYAQVFGSVEGNTTFYGTPNPARAHAWLANVEEANAKRTHSLPFSFCFKVPRAISHAKHPYEALQSGEAKQWFEFVRIMKPVLGRVLLQLPNAFSGERMSELLAMLDVFLQQDVTSVAVECRHLSFFDKSTTEQSLLRALSERQMDRVIFDSRGLFADRSGLPEVIEAQGKKPRFPVHAVATGRHPVVRFIGHSCWENNLEYLQQWQAVLNRWQREGREPYFFLHTAGNKDVVKFYEWLSASWGVDTLPAQTDLTKQVDLF